MRPCVECCCHVWAWNCWISYKNYYAGLLVLHCCLSWTLVYRRNVASLSFYYRYYFGRRLSKLAQLVPHFYSRRNSTRYSDRLHNFPVTIPRCYKDIYVNSFFSSMARIWNSLRVECFPLMYHSYKSRINRHLLSVGSFGADFLHALIFQGISWLEKRPVNGFFQIVP